MKIKAMLITLALTLAVIVSCVCVSADGAKITVSAAENAGGEMRAAGTADTLTFTVQNGAAREFTGANAAVVSDTKVTISDFSGAAVGVYTGTMTYTVVYTAPTP